MKKILFILSIAIFAGCEKNPVNRIIDPSSQGAVPQASGQYVVYDEELKTGGGVAFSPGGENQVFDIDDRSGPSRTRSQIRYNWNGGNVTNFNVTPTVLQHLFAGFLLTSVVDIDDLTSTPGRDLSSFGYTQMTFWARGNLPVDTTVVIEGPDDGSGGITPVSLTLDSSMLTGEWQRYQMFIPSTHFNDVRIFFASTFIYDKPPRATVTGNGGTIYFDDIQYGQ